MGGSKKISPEFKIPPDARGPSAQLAQLLEALMSGVGGGQIPLYGDFLPTAAAQRTLEEALATGLPVDTSPLYANLKNTFQTETAPAIQEALGARYGVRFGTPVSESLARAGRDVDLGFKAQTLPYLEAAQGRRAGLAQNVTSMGQSGLNSILQQILGGVGTLRQGAGFYQPQYQNNNQLGSLIQLAGIALAPYTGGASLAATGAALAAQQ